MLLVRFIWDKIQIQRAKEVNVQKSWLALGPNKRLIYTMLRRRRSLPGGGEGEVNSSQGGLMKRNREDAERVKKEKMAKLKMV